MEERENIISLTDDNGKEQDFEYIDFFEFEGKEYVVLLEVNGEEVDTDTVVIFEVQEVDEETDEFLPVEEELLERVFTEFQIRYEAAGEQ